jgi:hypothetical protein
LPFGRLESPDFSQMTKKAAHHEVYFVNSM